MLTGRRPFDSGRRRHLQDVLAQIERRAVDPPRTIDETISKHLESVCLKAMAKEPADRYTTAADMAADLRTAVAPRPPSRRRRCLLSLAGAAVFSLMLTFLWPSAVTDVSVDMFYLGPGSSQPVHSSDHIGPLRDGGTFVIEIAGGPYYFYVIVVADDGRGQVLAKTSKKVSQLRVPEDLKEALRLTKEPRDRTEAIIIIWSKRSLRDDYLEDLASTRLVPTDETIDRTFDGVVQVPLRPESKQRRQRSVEIINTVSEALGTALANKLPSEPNFVAYVYRHESAGTLEYAHESPDPDVTGRILEALAALTAPNPETDQRISDLTRHWEACMRADHDSASARLQATLDLGQALIGIGQADQALRVFSACLGSMQDTGADDPTRLARLLVLYGNVEAQMSRYDDARSHYERAREILRPFSPPNTEQWILLGCANDGIGTTLKAEREFDEAIRVYEKAIDCWFEAGLEADTEEECKDWKEARWGFYRSHLNRLIAYISAASPTIPPHYPPSDSHSTEEHGEVTEAPIRLYCEDLAKKLTADDAWGPDDPGLIPFYNALAEILLMQGQSGLAPAREYAAEAARIGRDTAQADQFGQEDVDHLLAMLQTQYVLAVLACEFGGEDELQVTKEALTGLLGCYELCGNKTQAALVQFYLGEVCLKRKEWGEALKWFRKAIKGLDELNTLPATRIRALCGAIKALLRGGKDVVDGKTLNEAIGKLEEAIRILEADAGKTIGGDAGNAKFWAHFCEVQDLLINLLRGQDPKRALFYADSFRARMLAAQMGAAGQNGKWHYEDFAANLSRLVDPQTAVLRYYLGIEETHLWVITADGVHHHLLTVAGDNKGDASAGVRDLSRIELHDMVSRYIQRIRRPPSADQGVRGIETDEMQVNLSGGQEAARFTSEAIALTNALLPPDIRRQLGEYKHVVIVLDGVLHRLPFQAMLVGSVGERRTYVLDCLPPVGYAPSIRIWAELQVRNTIEYPDRFGTARDSRLKDATRESNSFQGTFDSFGDVTVWTCGPGTEGDVCGLLESIGFFHFGGHAVFDGSAGYLNLLGFQVAHDADTHSDGRLEIPEIQPLDLSRCQLAVLGGCDTNVAPQLYMEVGNSLAHAFLAAGATRTVASQWRVDDEETLPLMTHFFNRLAEDMQADSPIDYAAALHSAMKTARDENPAPYYWAPFVLTGPARADSPKVLAPAETEVDGGSGMSIAP